MTDAQGIIQFANPAFERATGYSREEAVGQNARILKSGQQDEAFYRDLWDTISGGRIWKGRMVNKRKDGTLYTEETTISPVRDPAGRIVNYVAVKRDITAYLLLTAQFQQAQKMEAVGLLAGGVAHDYNNMLSVILGYVELALNKVDPDQPVHADLEEIYKAATRSADITCQLLAFARKQTIVPVVLDLNQTVEGMLKILRRLIGEDITLAWRSGVGLYPVKMDPVQVGQILTNLCVNARDAIAGVGEITIETGKRDFRRDLLRRSCRVYHGETMPLLAVSDDGCGMDKEVLEHNFRTFFYQQAGSVKERAWGYPRCMASSNRTMDSSTSIANPAKERLSESTCPVTGAKPSIRSRNGQNKSRQATARWYCWWRTSRRF